MPLQAQAVPGAGVRAAAFYGAEERPLQPDVRQEKTDLVLTFQWPENIPAVVKVILDPAAAKPAP